MPKNLIGGLLLSTFVFTYNWTGEHHIHHAWTAAPVSAIWLSRRSRSFQAYR
jgi:hypothetical protein